MLWPQAMPSLLPTTAQIQQYSGLVVLDACFPLDGVTQPLVIGVAWLWNSEG